MATKKLAKSFLTGRTYGNANQVIISLRFTKTVDEKYVFFSVNAGSRDSFIFSLSNKDNLPPFKSVLGRHWTKSYIVGDSRHGAIFGCGYDDRVRDISISGNANRNSTSFSDFGHAYTLPEGYVAGSKKARCLLAGSFNFTPTEVEVFY